MGTHSYIRGLGCAGSRRYVRVTTKHSTTIEKNLVHNQYHRCICLKRVQLMGGAVR